MKKTYQTSNKVGRENKRGFLQVLWERGWIDEGNINQNTMDGRKD
jgi:hypothetical protein